MSSFSSLVADYGSSSSNNNSSSDTDSDSDSDIAPNNDMADQEEGSSKLPPPEFGIAGTPTSVFCNPFVAAENAKKAILEKHVKMTPTREETTMINGKRICWNYRKGRCRFGHNCKFAHDSDLHRSDCADDNLPELEVLAQNTPGGITVGGGAQPLVEQAETEDGELTRKKKKRPGLSDHIVPGKKVMKMYKKQKAKDTPWIQT